MIRRRLTLAVVAVAGIALAAVTASSAHAAQEASCYGPGLYGNPMANGVHLYVDTIAVAHKTLPLGTELVVAYRGRTVRAKVQDRGPYVPGRHLDLTEATVGQLGFSSCTSWGHRKVRSWRAR